VVAKSTLFVLGDVLGGSPSQGEGGGTVGGGPGSGESLDTGSTAGSANAGLIGEGGWYGKVTRKKSKSSAEHKAEWRKGKGNVEKELAQKRERQKRKRPEKQKTPSAERNAKWRKKETNVEKELAPKREKRTAAKKKPASSAEQSADWCNKEGMIWPKL